MLLTIATTPVVATTSDNTSNDYTATVQTDLSMALRTGAKVGRTSNSLTPVDGKNSATGVGHDGSGNVSVTIEPTTGTSASFRNGNQFDASSNVAFDLAVQAQTSTAGQFEGTGQVFSTDNLAFQLKSPLYDSKSAWKFLPGDGSAMTFLTGQSPGEYNGQYVRYGLKTPNDLKPGTYKATIVWSITPN